MRRLAWWEWPRGGASWAGRGPVERCHWRACVPEGCEGRFGRHTFALKSRLRSKRVRVRHNDGPSAPLVETSTARGTLRYAPRMLLLLRCISLVFNLGMFRLGHSPYLRVS